MAKYFLYNLYSGIDTFSTIPAGDEFSFDTTNFNPQITFSNDDIIVCYSSPGLFYVLKVVESTHNSIKVYKSLEFFNDNFITFDSGINIKEITSNEFNNLLEVFFNDFITKSVLPFEKIDDYKLLSKFAKWLNTNPKSNYYENDFDKTVKGLEKIDEKYNAAFGNSVFDVDFDNLEEFTESVNNNIWNKESSFWTYSDATSTHLPRAILNENNYQRFLREFQQKKNKDFQPKNTIYYGAPGTGKSYKVDQIIKDLDPKFYQRVTFHPEFDNASFVGGYKPFSEKNDDKEDVVSYKFVPQAFAKIYTDAWKDLDNDYYLVIEEINRGNCAEIFGEIFQLLDRNSNYTVSPSKELNDHLIEKFDNNKEHEGIAKGLKLPSNLHILATMNTSDQSLFPMDSAFKRRWEWEYVPICYEVQNEEGKSNESFNFEIDLGDGSKYKWIDFIAKINNNHIKNNQALGMDKCIGNYFIKPDNANNITLKPFINKVIFYLWNDVFKDEDNKVFESNGSYEDFFPILTNGLTKVKELFERIELTPIPAYPSREEEQDLGQVAEEDQPLTE